MSEGIEKSAVEQLLVKKFNKYLDDLELDAGSTRSARFEIYELIGLDGKREQRFFVSVHDAA